MLPILELIDAGQETIADCLPGIRQHFLLNDMQMEELLPSGRQTTISNRSHWARNYMKHAGLVEPIARGRYRATALGKDLLAKKPSYIDKAVLEKYPAYRVWTARKPVDQSDMDPGLAVSLSPQTPEERIEEAYEPWPKNFLNRF
ncbi:MAG: winged helix-turn-helix domain-containing protein [Paracoccus sp. (in: a-proteobacteria)]